MVFRKATRNDLESILALLSTGTPDDLNHLVCMPEPFYSYSLKSEIEKGRVFVAVNKINNAIVAQRRIFIVECQKELRQILEIELRCVHEQKVLIEHGFFNQRLEFFPQDHKHFIHHEKVLYLYIGGAFTHLDYRHKRLNERLNTYVYEQLLDEVYRKIRTQDYTKLALLCGFVDECGWRINSLIRPFFPFAQSISSLHGKPLATKISFFAYKTVKPTFTLSITGELVCLPDEECCLGHGCILLYNLY